MRPQKNPAERRDAPPILLHITHEDRERVKEISAKEHLKPATWLYKVFKEALNEASET